jgi:hypothetical protein
MVFFFGRGGLISVPFNTKEGCIVLSCLCMCPYALLFGTMHIFQQSALYSGETCYNTLCEEFSPCLIRIISYAAGHCNSLPVMLVKL